MTLVEACFILKRRVAHLRKRIAGRPEHVGLDFDAQEADALEMLIKEVLGR